MRMAGYHLTEKLTESTDCGYNINTERWHFKFSKRSLSLAGRVVQTGYGYHATASSIKYIALIGGAGYNVGSPHQAGISELVLRAGNGNPKELPGLCGSVQPSD